MRPWPSVSPLPPPLRMITTLFKVAMGLCSEMLSSNSQSPLLLCYHPPWSQPTGRCLRVINVDTFTLCVPYFSRKLPCTFQNCHGLCVLLVWIYPREDLSAFPLLHIMDRIPTLLSWGHSTVVVWLEWNQLMAPLFKVGLRLILIGGECFDHVASMTIIGRMLQIRYHWPPKEHVVSGVRSQCAWCGLSTWMPKIWYESSRIL